MWYRTKLKKLKKGLVLSAYKNSPLIRQRMKYFLQVNGPWVSSAGLAPSRFGMAAIRSWRKAGKYKQAINTAAVRVCFINLCIGVSK